MNYEDDIDAIDNHMNIGPAEDESGVEVDEDKVREMCFDRAGIDDLEVAEACVKDEEFMSDLIIILRVIARAKSISLKSIAHTITGLNQSQNKVILKKYTREMTEQYMTENSCSG